MVVNNLSAAPSIRPMKMLVFVIAYPCLDVLDEVPQLEDLGDQTGKAEHGRAAEPRHEQGQGAGKKGAKRIPGEFAREFAELVLELGVCHFVLMRHCGGMAVGPDCGCLWVCAAHECFTRKCDKVRCYRQSLKFKVIRGRCE